MYMFFVSCLDLYNYYDDDDGKWNEVKYIYAKGTMVATYVII